MSETNEPVTLIDFLAEKNLLEQFLTNIEKCPFNNSTNRVKYVFERLKENTLDISGSFEFTKSIEGHIYWHKVGDEYEARIKASKP